MSKRTTESSPNYGVRLGAAGLVALSLGAGATKLAMEGAHAATANVKKAVRTVDVPPETGAYKSFHLGDQFEVDGKKVTITSLDQAGRLANLPGVLPVATTNMLVSELPAGMAANDVPDSVTFRLPTDAAIGNYKAIE